MKPVLRPMLPLTLQLRPDGEWYPSTVLDLEEGREILVGVPLQGGYEVRVDPGTQIRVASTHPDGVRAFSARVVAREMGRVPGLRLSWPEAVERVQRREHVRVDILLPVEVEIAEEEGGTRVLRGVTADLSAGGARVLLGERIALGTPLTIRLHLPGGPPLESAGKIVRAVENPGAAPEQRHALGVEFAGLDPAGLRTLTRFVFDVQREHLRKGLG